MTKITIPGFQFAGLHVGIKDSARKKDLALIYSENPNTLVDGVFTTNRVCAAPVMLCREVVKKGRGQLVVINSGVANACTGKRGLKDARRTQQEAARIFEVEANRVFVSSTGKIGDRLPMPKLLNGLKKAKDYLGPKNFLEAVKGMMTTDQYPKYGVLRDQLFGKKYTLAVLAKGAGMLCPHMATMLAYVITDLHFHPTVLRAIFRRAVNQTLNRITVDGDTSTNDTVLILANGHAGNAAFAEKSAEGRRVEKQLRELLELMAQKITLDGEGATKCCLVRVNGARNVEDAKKIAYAIGNSPLVKTALFGCDPNWGRIVAAVGYSGASIDPTKIRVGMGPFCLVKNGVGVKQKKFSNLIRYMKKQKIEMYIDCSQGVGSYHVYMSDLTYDYIHLNAEYHT